MTSGQMTNGQMTNGQMTNGQITCWQSDKLTKWQVYKMTSIKSVPQKTCLQYGIFGK